MSLLTLCKSGNLEGVKAALSRGDLGKMSCAEKLEYAMAALGSKQNAALMETLMEHLGLDQFGQIHNIGHAMYHWAAVKTKPKSMRQQSFAFLDFHSNSP